MELAILLVLLIPSAFLLGVAVLAIFRTARMGDETPGWTRLRRHLPIYKIPANDRPVQFRWPERPTKPGGDTDR